MKTIYEDNYKFEEFDNMNFEDANFDNESIYAELDNIENLDDLADRGVCAECGDPNGYLSIDPYANMYEEGANVYLCRQCSQDVLY